MLVSRGRGISSRFSVDFIFNIVSTPTDKKAIQSPFTLLLITTIKTNHDHKLPHLNLINTQFYLFFSKYLSLLPRSNFHLPRAANFFSRKFQTFSRLVSSWFCSLQPSYFVQNLSRALRPRPRNRKDISLHHLLLTLSRQRKVISAVCSLNCRAILRKKTDLNPGKSAHF